MKLKIFGLTIALLFTVFSVETQGQTRNPFLSASPEELGFSSERLQRLADMLHSYSEEQKMAGGVALVLRDGYAVFYESFGKLDVESDIDMPKDAMFRIASQTKAIVSVGVMMLQEEGLLLIGDPVGKYLPEFTQTNVAVANDNDGYDVVPANRSITIRDLLMHTSGFSYGYGTAIDEWREAGFLGWYLSDRDEPIRDLVRRIAELPAESHPGDRFVYGYSTDILGALIEVVSGQSLDVFLKDRIFDPLGMTDTHFFVPQNKANRIATVYSATENRGIVRAPEPGAGVGQGHYLMGPRTTFSGGAGLVSTATDYARFMQMMFNGGEFLGQRLLSPTTVELMTVNHLHNIEFRPGVGVGLGFDVVTDLGARGIPGAVGDYGWGGAYHSTYWISPQDGLVVLFFTQLIPATGSDIHGKFRTLLYQSLIE
ncbi:MAG: beta-lactamase family protein [Balneolales bacterium]|nr:beta-lactamase family protein [Balneolales bacterium]